MVLTCELTDLHLEQAYTRIDREEWAAYLLESRNILFNDDIVSVIENSIESIEYFIVEVPSKTISLSDQLALYLTGSLIERSETQRRSIRPLIIRKKAYRKKMRTGYASVKNNGIVKPGNESQPSDLVSAPMPPVNLTTRNGNVAGMYATSNGTGGEMKKNSLKKNFNPKRNNGSTPD